MTEIKTLKQANDICGSTGYAGGMSGPTYGTPAKNCQTGSKLAKYKPRPHPKTGELLETPCSHCYVFESLNYSYPSVEKAQTIRQEGLLKPAWLEAQVYKVKHEKVKHGKDPTRRRVKDSGDVQSVRELELWNTLAKETPTTRYWLATQEKGLVREFKKANAIAPNFTIRQSATFINHPEPQHRQSSVVLRFEAYKEVLETGKFKGQPIKACEKFYNGTHNCGPCDACWRPEVKMVGYLLHKDQKKLDNYLKLGSETTTK